MSQETDNQLVRLLLSIIPPEREREFRKETQETRWRTARLWAERCKAAGLDVTDPAALAANLDKAKAEAEEEFTRVPGFGGYM